ncbi:sugar 3,4-ketoisomerase [Pontibacter chitinilyticus]|uniref:sugar 3,4-ketoisomerase n=1 Tax=Pontibacter chitinilyticus TaxID=2674989 RepID=UPI00321B9036
MPASPYTFPFHSIGSPAEGFVTTTQCAGNLPFAVKRVFWTHGTPAAVVRGRHAHKATEQVLVAVQGRIRVAVDNGSTQQTFILDAPDQGLYLPPLHWANLNFEEGALLLCLTSSDFSEADYIRSYEAFQQAIQALKR